MPRQLLCQNIIGKNRKIDAPQGPFLVFKVKFVSVYIF